MDYQELVRDFADRTRTNLQTLRRLKEEDPEAEVYEVTQLMNSMLGLLIFPSETYVQRIPKTPLSELACQGWPIPEVVGSYPQVAHLKELVRYMRNAIAHCNVRFLSDEDRQIIGVELWNERTRRALDGRQIPTVTWKARLTIDDLEKITDKFIDMLLEP
jgi:hypothetical protein